jgi:hypothetical protein
MRILQRFPLKRILVNLTMMVILIAGDLVPFPTPLEELDRIQVDCHAKGIQGFAVVKVRPYNLNWQHA